MRDLLNVNSNSNLPKSGEFLIREIPKIREPEILAVEMEMAEEKKELDEIQVFKFESENHSNINKKSALKTGYKKILNKIKTLIYSLNINQLPNQPHKLLGFWLVSCSVVFGYCFYADITMNKSIENEVKSLTELMRVIDKESISQKDFSQLNTEFLIKNQLIPEGFSISKDNKLVNALGGQVLVSKANNPEQYKVTYTNVSSKACSLIVKESASLFNSIELNEEIVKEKKYPLNSVVLKEACLNKDSNEITFITNKKE